MAGDWVVRTGGSSLCMYTLWHLHQVSNVLTLKVTLNVTPLAVLTRECWRESCTGDISGSEGMLLVMI